MRKKLLLLQFLLYKLFLATLNYVFNICSVIWKYVSQTNILLGLNFSLVNTCIPLCWNELPIMLKRSSEEIWKISMKEFYPNVEMWGDNLIDYWIGPDFPLSFRRQKFKDEEIFKELFLCFGQSVKTDHISDLFPISFYTKYFTTLLFWVF